jgi:predicted dehydrogenase
VTKKVAVLGLGSIGLRHSKNFISLNCSVSGYDPSPERRVALESAGGHPAPSRDAALADSDIAVVATPNKFHRDDAAAALAAGCHVLVEKPFAHTTAGLAALLDDADKSGRVIAVAHNLRFNPVAKAARELIEAGRIGSLIWARFACGSYLPNWRPHEDYRQGYAAEPGSGGVIFDIVHEFDLATFLLGPLRTEHAVARRTGFLDIPTEDCADILLRDPDGRRVSLHLDYLTRPVLRTSDIVGTEGRIELDLVRRHIRLLRADGTSDFEEQAATAIDQDYRDLAETFIRSTEQKIAPVCPGREALEVLQEVVSARKLAGLGETP